MAPLPAREVSGEPGFDLLGLPVCPLEEKAVEVERQHLPAAFPHEPSLLLEGLIDFVINPPTRERGLGAAEQHLIPEPDTSVDLVVDVIAGEKLMLV
jgi:hypothetical protein